MALMENKVIGGINMTLKEARQKLFSKWHYMLVDEAEVMEAVKIINTGTKVPGKPDTFVRHADLVNKPERWYISCTCYNKEWPAIHDKLVSTIKSVEVLH